MFSPLRIVLALEYKILLFQANITSGNYKFYLSFLVLNLSQKIKIQKKS